MTHVPLCYTCDDNEVQAPFTFRDGTGFCSASCEDLAWNTEEPYNYEKEELEMDLAYETAKDNRYY